MKSTFTIAALAGCANAFWGTAHLLVARQAEALLAAENSKAYNWAVNSLNVLRANDPYITKSEKNHPFTECATFADDIKGKGYSW